MLQVNVSQLESLSQYNFSNIYLCEEILLSNFLHPIAARHQQLFFSRSVCVPLIVPRSFCRVCNSMMIYNCDFPSKTQRVLACLVKTACEELEAISTSPIAIARAHTHTYVHRWHVFGSRSMCMPPPRSTRIPLAVAFRASVQMGAQARLRSPSYYYTGSCALIVCLALSMAGTHIRRRQRRASTLKIIRLARRLV